MQSQGESEFARTPMLENRAFFTCVQCGYCGYLILGGSAKELRDEEERHAIKCKATHGLIGAGKLGWGTMRPASRQYDCNFRRHQQGLKDIQGCESVLIVSWLGTLLLWGFLWWAAFKLLCDVAQFVQHVPRLLK
jgi:hypothetical protein